MVEISEITASLSDLPLKEPFETAKGRKTSSPAVVMEMRLSNGVSGMGAATPVKYVTGEDVDSVISAVDMCKGDLIGMDPRSYRAVFVILGEALPHDPSARAGLEIAALDAFCKLHDLPMWRFFGGRLDRVETDVTIPITTPENARELAREAAENGFDSLKVKVGSADVEEDIARVRAMSEGAPRCTIRADANQGFVPTVAVGFVHSLLSAGIKLDMLEQPVDYKDLDGLRYVTQHTSVPVFADESVQTPADAIKLVELDAVDGMNIKLMKSGIAGALDIIAICRAARKELMLGCMIESAFGFSAAIHLAAGTGVFSRLDLDAHLLLAEQPGTSGLFTADGPWLRPAVA
jgi:L-alanine-DL-glutamate epimerase-like enolase superfamily enzyme